ncbi:MAG: hypothetical protein K2K44_07015 [Oscillospiraceae bacterium]|nr:hypothetical protein [Oscillospiraceae bacterium]
MPRIMLDSASKQDTRNQNSFLSAVRTETKQNIMTSEADRERTLRKSRSKEYMDKLCKLDTGEYNDEGGVEKILDEVRKEFPLIEIPGDFVGYISKCWLGDDYEVHTVDFTGNIIEHFKRNQPLIPPEMEKARGLACDEHYQLIEVYTGCLRAIHENGDVSVIKF